MTDTDWFAHYQELRDEYRRLKAEGVDYWSAFDLASDLVTFHLIGARRNLPPWLGIPTP